MPGLQLMCVCAIQYDVGLPEGSELLTVSSYVRSVEKKRKKNRVSHMTVQLSSSVPLTLTN